MIFKRVLVTGGAGFIGSEIIRYGLKNFPFLETIVNLDLLTYAADEKNMADFKTDEKHIFVQGNISDQTLVKKLCQDHRIEAVIHSAAETHVDRSIDDPSVFIEANIVGTFSLLEVVRQLPYIRFHHISTDEVYGSIKEGFFNETSNYKPNSPYSATKAASDHLVRAWGKTYGLSVTLSHCSNNYGPFQHVEKFIPSMITRCFLGKPLPVYGEGLNIRDWLYVEDHAAAIWLILEKGIPGEVYDIGGQTELCNIDLLHHIIDRVAAFLNKDKKLLQNLITFVKDRPGHDFRYAIDCSKIRQNLGWKQQFDLNLGLQKTIKHFYENSLCNTGPTEIVTVSS